ncbi:MAG: hypothetical protein IKB70_06475 [Bacilli bacterium]|nr:hypothetical protein [Bacilli bacterium]
MRRYFKVTDIKWPEHAKIKPKEIRFLSLDNETIEKLFLDGYKMIPLEYKLTEMTKEEADKEALHIIINGIY